MLCVMVFSFLVLGLGFLALEWDLKLVIDWDLGLILGLAGGLVGMLLFGGGAYFLHYVLRLLLAQSSILPWRAVPFLEEATNCILLQRVSGGYRFIHLLLQEHFASLHMGTTSEDGTQ